MGLKYSEIPKWISDRGISDALHTQMSMQKVVKPPQNEGSIDKSEVNLMYRVEKIISEGLELLPNIVDTSIWRDVDEFNNDRCSKTVRLVSVLYRAIEQRENYYQLNTPTAFGDPQYTLRCGVVIGILQGAELEEVIEDEKIVIKRNNRRILIVDKVKRPQAYRDAVRENSETLRALGL